MRVDNKGGTRSLLIAFAIAAGAVSSFAQAGDVYSNQFQRSVEGMMANMLGNGATIASPSRSNPNYYFDWVRDTSLTMKTLIQLQADSRLPVGTRQEIARRVDRWINWELARQETPTLITGLGEPRFYVDGRANPEPWGRPQNDGPALRAIAAIELAQQWIAQGRMADVKARLYRAELPAKTLIKRDLEYVSHHFQDSSYDLWEEERALHFYTLSAQMVALIKGAKLAALMDDKDGADFYGKAAASIQGVLRNFIDPNRKIIRYAINKVVALPHKKSDLDIAVLLAAIQTFDGKFYLPMPEVVNTVNALTEAFTQLYPVNKILKDPKGVDLGVAMGRYPDDKYSGFDFSIGNPWFISTLALAEFACDLERVGYAPQARARIRDTAKKQFDRVLYHLGPNGTMSEQFRRDNGFEQGARDLTWSYTSYVTAYRACFPQR